MHRDFPWAERRRELVIYIKQSKVCQKSALACLSLAKQRGKYCIKSNLNREGGEVKQLFPSIQPVEYFRFFWEGEQALAMPEWESLVSW